MKSLLMFALLLTASTFPLVAGAQQSTAYTYAPGTVTTTVQGTQSYDQAVTTTAGGEMATQDAQTNEDASTYSSYGFDGTQPSDGYTTDTQTLDPGGTYAESNNE